MISDKIQILLVEDNFADARLLQEFLSKPEKFEIVHVELLTEAINYLSQRSFDVILLDLSLPDGHGLKTLAKVVDVTEKTNKVPIIVLTGLDDEETAVEALRQGAQDYLVKGEIHRSWLWRALQYAIERQQVLEKLRNLNEQLMQTNQELEQFACIVSHDLQQPLQRIVGFAQILAKKYKGSWDDKADLYVNYIADTSILMGRLIKDLLAYSRVGKSSQSNIPIDCNQVLSVVLTNLEMAIKNSAAIVSSQSLPIILADMTELTQLFQNLIDNAIKYCPQTQPPRIQITVKRKEREWVFAIKDNGIGIEPEYFQSIFEIFFSLNTEQQQSGTGIGLAICKKIITRLGGCIWVDSLPGLGSTFYFTLPVWENH